MPAQVSESVRMQKTSTGILAFSASSIGRAQSVLPNRSPDVIRTTSSKWITVKLRPSRFRQDMAADKKQHGLGFICPRDNPILSTRSTNQVESFPTYLKEITVRKVQLPSAGGRIAVTASGTPSHFLHARRRGGNMAEGEGIEPPVALASARQFSGLVTLPTRPPLCTIWRRRQGLEPVRFAQGKLCTRVTRTVLARRCDADSAHISTTRCARGDSNSHAQRRRCLGPLWLPVSPLAQNWCADRDSNPDACARRSQRRLYARSSIGTNLVRAEGFEPP